MAAVVMAIVAAAPIGCGGSSDASGSSLTVRLAEQNGSGQSGTATFTALGEDSTRIVLELSNPPAAPQPAHVHRGLCADLGEVVAELASVSGGRSETEAPISLDRLEQGGLVVHAHKSEAEYDVSVACAPIGRHAGRTDY
jgi:hypothetical protein